MKNKLTRGLLIIVVSSLILIAIVTFLLKPKEDLKTENVAVKPVSSQILADGQVTSQNEAKLNFQVGGKLTYLPYKEGASVSAGQTIASLDTYALQRQLSIALNNYQSQRDTFDQQQQNAQTGVLQGQQKYNLDVLNKSGIGGSGETNIINDMAKRILDQNQAGLNNSVSQVELANYALQLASLTTPISGVITHEDVNVPNVNVTPATTFIVDDPNAIVFRAYVSEDEIDFVSEGAAATVSINGNSNKTYSGNVVEIHPQKLTLANGQSVYQVDVLTDDLKGITQFGQSGSVQIQSNAQKSTRLVPTWTILNGQYIWVNENGKKTLKKVKVGKTHGEETEILDGLSPQDSIVVSPKSIIANKYQIL